MHHIPSCTCRRLMNRKIKSHRLSAACDLTFCWTEEPSDNDVFPQRFAILCPQVGPQFSKTSRPIASLHGDQPRPDEKELYSCRFRVECHFSPTDINFSHHHEHLQRHRRSNPNHSSRRVRRIWRMQDDEDTSSQSKQTRSDTKVSTSNPSRKTNDGPFRAVILRTEKCSEATDNEYKRFAASTWAALSQKSKADSSLVSWIGSRFRGRDYGQEAQNALESYAEQAKLSHAVLSRTVFEKTEKRLASRMDPVEWRPYGGTATATVSGIGQLAFQVARPES
jgi:hypothetical protein